MNSGADQASPSRLSGTLFLRSGSGEGGVENDGTPRGWRNSRECALGFLRRESDERSRRGYTEGCRKIGEGEVLGGGSKY